ncbi:signal peptide-containing protein [Theileria equi strain WA]|uniref:Signal peptide-containing protein n=1 Tax=Theileria equi strain WA TaxID=1537102 RepID=L0AY65_THEEQ|nr:signal peptide-containing protein [Theileria equi strain WA]AFZ80203.1 signal peptide-containing protein [Theileria equi strain WA]|eukprot:XP_004829869.1 signal peptide-containing protein [Theileria equi strain WA]
MEIKRVNGARFGLTKRLNIVILLAIVWSIGSISAVPFNRGYSNEGFATHPVEDNDDDDDDDVSPLEYSGGDVTGQDDSFLQTYQDEDDYQDYEDIFEHGPDDGDHKDSMMEVENDDEDQKPGELKRYLDRIGAIDRAKRAFKSGRERVASIKRAIPEGYRNVKGKLASGARGKYGKRIGKYVKDKGQRLRRGVGSVYNRLRE